ncbi:hypothetical protein MPVG_00182 [Micromonas pusilla virus 12T]|jgi:hypothetical protein|uniref:hypothetical protein n=1 Tax=Micromonas pusilla virus 12T TaxID=755272 RepID=UPI0002C0C2E9|nr:hypothetical protein MPVG_00182 [Micromonas pusilla virus 12T]AGH31002.1 hypothetical protein MPVG_00182 [Micromonas pusilla virus 12T]
MMFTQVQIVLLAVFLFVLVTTKNLGNRPAIAIFAATTLLHMYDHLFLVKRGKEKKLVENYACPSCSGA